MQMHKNESCFHLDQCKYLFPVCSFKVIEKRVGLSGEDTKMKENNN